MSGVQGFEYSGSSCFDKAPIPAIEVAEDALMVCLLLNQRYLLEVGSGVKTRSVAAGRWAFYLTVLEHPATSSLCDTVPGWDR